MLVMAITTKAQLSVASFTKLDDLDARLQEYTKTDADGVTCAIIKVVTTESGFTFDCGMLGVTATVPKPELAEIWVYVPRGVRKLKIAHPRLGQVQSDSGDGYYWLPLQVEAATCYRLVLKSGKPPKGGVPTDEGEGPTVETGWLIINSEPSGADVFLTINGVESLEGQTPFQKKLAYGRYNFRLKKSLYHDEPGVADINQGRVNLNATLRPAYGRISISSNPSGAKVSIDGLRETYTTPCTTDILASGEYTVRLSKEKYGATQQRVTVQDGQTARLDVPLQANFATIRINTLNGAEIYLNGTKVGTTSYSAELTPGLYEFEARLASHRDAKRQVEVEANHPQTIQLDPTPIYGSLDVMTTPMDATITIDGRNYGTTPQTISRLLVGSYTVTLAKQGCSSESRTVTVSEGRTAELNVTLSSGKEIAFNSVPSGADVYIDGQRKGTTPVTLTLSFGQHNVRLQKGDDKVEDKINVSATSSQNSYRYEIGNDQTFTVNGVSFKMIKVQGGTFTMGATSEQGSEADSDEKPTHSVTLRTYYIGETEVTQALWTAVMGSNPSRWKGDNLPVESVSWNDVQTFVTKLNQLTGKQFRLPTEAEWEYAARGGNKSKGYKYSGSNSLGTVAWYYDNSNSQTHAVKTKSPNELGLYDMSGNVYEWCQDWYGSYSSGAQTNPTGPSFGSHRVGRGGSWSYNARRCRVSLRRYYDPTFRLGGLGFRLVLP